MAWPTSICCPQLLAFTGVHLHVGTELSGKAVGVGGPGQVADVWVAMATARADEEGMPIRYVLVTNTVYALPGDDNGQLTEVVGVQGEGELGVPVMSSSGRSGSWKNISPEYTLSW